VYIYRVTQGAKIVILPQHKTKIRFCGYFIPITWLQVYPMLLKHRIIKKKICVLLVYICLSLTN